MNRIKTMLKVVKMLLNSWKKSTAVYLGIAIFIYSSIVFSLRASLEFGEMTLVGITIANAIYIFILAIASFAEDFGLAVSMNVSRRIFFTSKTLALTTLSIILTIIDLAVGNLLAHLTEVRFNPIISWTLMLVTGQESSLYLNRFIILMPAFIFLFLAATTGWLIRLLYYRTNKLQKILLSISPVVLLYLFRLPFNDTVRSIIMPHEWFGVFFRITEDLLNYFAITVIDEPLALISFFIIFSLAKSIISLILCYLLIRRAPAA